METTPFELATRADEAAQQLLALPSGQYSVEMDNLKRHNPAFYAQVKEAIKASGNRDAG